LQQAGDRPIDLGTERGNRISDRMTEQVSTRPIAIQTRFSPTIPALELRPTKSSVSSA
jgi:hypothetical protein